MAKKRPVELTREFFVKNGKKGGEMGGALAWAGLTAAERSARAQANVAKRKWHPVKPVDPNAPPPKPKKSRKKA